MIEQVFSNKISPLIFKQEKELGELFGYEARNKFRIESPEGEHLASAAERDTGFGGILARQFLGHWRKFEINFYDKHGQYLFRAVHPFRWFFQRIEIEDSDSRFLGAIEQRWSILYKKFDLHDASGQTIMTVSSPLWKLWTFDFERNGVQIARVKKKWGGVLKEMFLDADSFALEWNSELINKQELSVLLGATLFIDLNYFERKASD